MVTRESWHAQKTLADGLTPKQWEVADLIAEGWTNSVIAKRLGIGRHVVEVHINSIYGKIGCDEEHVPRVCLARKVWERDL